MRKRVKLEELLSGIAAEPERVPEFFALFNLGLVDAMTNGLLEVEDAVRYFYHGDNCIYVKRHIKNRAARSLMGHGVQLPDLFDALPVEQARREFFKELAIMRALCLRILEEQRSVA